MESNEFWGVSPNLGVGLKIRKLYIDYAFTKKRSSVTLVHKGNIMKFTEGAFMDWGYALAKREYGAQDYQGGPWQVIEKDGHQLIIKDVIYHNFTFI